MTVVNLDAYRQRKFGDRWMTQVKAAAYMGVTPRTIRNWTKAGLPSRKLGKASGSTRLYRQSDLDAWNGEMSSDPS